MKQVRLFTGGHKFHNEDFEYTRDGMLDTFNAIVDGLSDNQTFSILSGVVLTPQGGTSYTWTEGVVRYLGQYYFVPAEATSTDLANSSFNLVEIPDALNPVIYRDGASRDVHVDTQFQLVAGVGGTVAGLALILPNVRLIEQVRENLIANLTEDFLNAQNEFGWQSLTPYIGADLAELEPVQYRKIGDKVEIRGLLEYSGAGSNPNVFVNFPAALLPTSPSVKRVVIGIQSAASPYTGELLFTWVSSNVNLGGWNNPTGNSFFNLDNISYLIK